jgi:hypothetical protein
MSGCGTSAPRYVVVRFMASDAAPPGASVSLRSRPTRWCEECRIDRLRSLVRGHGLLEDSGRCRDDSGLDDVASRLRAKP